jgi:ABC-type glycerol-3-phosphate transport system permease component
MPQLRNYLVAVLVGGILAWAAVMAMGTLAAIPISPAFLAAQRNSPVLVFTLTTTLLVQVPAILLSSLVGWSFFRLTRRATIGLVVALAFPWIGLVLFWSWPSISSVELAAIE